MLAGHPYLRLEASGSLSCAVALVVSLLGACATADEPDPRAPGTIRMAARLIQLAAEVDPRTDIFVNTARAEVMRAEGAPADAQGRLQFNAQLAQELLRAGQAEQAIDLFRQVLTETESSGAPVPDGFAIAVRDLLAASHLYLGVRENCVVPGRTERCLVPLTAEAVYPLDRGPRAAVAEYRRILEIEPENWVARWLLNLGHMMLGSYPDSVPPAWRIPPAAFRSEHDVGRFPDVAPALGLNVLGHAGGAIMDDLTGDGYLDIMVSSRGLRDQLRYFQNLGDGTFTERTIAAGLEGLIGGINLTHADYDNDGDLDVLVLRGGWLPVGYPNSLLRNNGDGTFEDVTEEAGLLAPHPTQTAAWGDFDNDGLVDLVIGNETAGRTPHPCELFRNNGDGTFTDVARDAGVAVVGFVKAVAWGDYDNDGRLDLYMSLLDAPNKLYRNAGPNVAGVWSFEDVTSRTGVAEPIESFPAWFWDYDNDGWLDIFVSGRRGTSGDVAAEYAGAAHGAEVPRLYHNRGDGTFDDVTQDARVARVMHTMGSNYGDLDNDGYLDFHAGTGDPDFRALIPNRMFRNAEGRYFQDVTTAGGFGHIMKGHGTAFGDIDNDGDQDVYVVLGAAFEGDIAYNVLFENPGHGNRWITLRLEGVTSNRAAIGARIEVEVETRDGIRTIHRTVTGGGSFGASSLQQEIGLGRAAMIHAVSVTWPTTGRTDRHTGLAMERMYTIREGDPHATPIEMRRLRLTGSPTSP